MKHTKIHGNNLISKRPSRVCKKAGIIASKAIINLPDYKPKIKPFIVKTRQNKFGSFKSIELTHNWKITTEYKNSYSETS